MKVSNQRAIVLHDDQLCIMASNDLRDKIFTSTCYPLFKIIPQEYASSHEYD